MAQPSRKAEFFVQPDGICIPKAKPLTTNQKYAVYLRDKKKCQVCGIPVACGGSASGWHFNSNISPGHVDHITPRCIGGQNNEENLRMTCCRCNLSKGQKHAKT